MNTGKEHDNEYGEETTGWGGSEYDDEDSGKSVDHWEDNENEYGEETTGWG